MPANEIQPFVHQISDAIRSEISFTTTELCWFKCFWDKVESRKNDNAYNPSKEIMLLGIYPCMHQN